MPYRKKSYSSTKRRKSTAWYNKKYSTLQIAKKALAATKYMRGMINSEKMYLDRVFTLGANKSTLFNITSIAQGDQPGQRTGNSILVRSIYMRGFIQVNPAVTGNTRLSLVLVQDLQQISDVTPAITDVFTSDDPEALIRTGATTNTAGRFKIMWRKNYSVNTTTTPNINLDKFWKQYTHIKFNGTTAGDIQKNGLYLIVLTSESTNFPTFSATVRTGYYDN